MIVLFLALLYIGTMIYLANREVIQQKQPLLVAMHYGLVLLLVIWILNALVFVVIPAEQVNDPTLADQINRVDTITALLFVGLATVAIGLIVAMTRSDSVYIWFSRILSGTSSDAKQKYNPASPVHQLAIVLMIVQTVSIVWTLMVSGGLDGLDFSYDNPLQALSDLASGGLIYLIVALLGVGWLTRRDATRLIQRLGLRFPTRQDWVWGIGIALIVYLFSRFGSEIWILVTPTEVIEQQTIATRQLFEVFSESLILGFLLAIITGVSEEILFRGALQPVFGLVASSIFFTILHIQYALTPATLILFIVSLGFGWARQHASTTASIIAHSTYNFIPFLLFTLATTTGTI